MVFIFLILEVVGLILSFLFSYLIISFVLTYCLALGCGGGFIFIYVNNENFRKFREVFFRGWGWEGDIYF